MNKSLREKWIQRLESGQDKQVTGKLYRDGGFCCLGVLCDIIDPTKWSKEPNSFKIWNGVSGLGLPLKTKRAIHLSTGQEGILVTMNDSEKKTFPEIAKWIRENVKVDGE